MQINKFTTIIISNIANGNTVFIFKENACQYKHAFPYGNFEVNFSIYVFGKHFDIIES